MILEHLTLNGPVAQRLAQATHNRLVAGSNPAGPTFGIFLVGMMQKMLTGLKQDQGGNQLSAQFKSQNEFIKLCRCGR